MNQDELREKLALRLYGELSDEETAELELALATDEESRHFAVELEQGLGRAARVSDDHDEGSGAFSEGLRRAIASEPIAQPSAFTRWYWAAAIGFAAGLLFARTSGRVAVQETSTETAAVTAEGDVHADGRGFERDQPPPRATGSGRLARLGLVLGR